MKKVYALLIALLLVCSLPVTALAHDVPDLDRTGSIEIVVRYDGQAVAGGQLTCYRVGEIYEDDGNYSFVRVLDGEPLDDITSPALAEELLAFAEDRGLPGLTVDIDSNGRARFTGLELGLYVIAQYDAADGYELLGPFLVSLPYMEDGVYLYDVTASAKSELKRVPETEPPKDEKLPQTGQLNWPVPLLAVSGLAVFSLGCVLCFGKKKETHEK